jgi:hypothetical protein
MKEPKVGRLFIEIGLRRDDNINGHSIHVVVSQVHCLVLDLIMVQ